MDLARYHHDQVEFYRAEIDSTTDNAGPLYTRLTLHKKHAEELRSLARYLDGVESEQPANTVSGHGMRSNDDGIPWERP